MSRIEKVGLLNMLATKRAGPERETMPTFDKSQGKYKRGPCGRRTGQSGMSVLGLFEVYTERRG